MSLTAEAVIRLIIEVDMKRLVRIGMKRTKPSVGLIALLERYIGTHDRDSIQSAIQVVREVSICGVSHSDSSSNYFPKLFLTSELTIPMST